MNMKLEDLDNDDLELDEPSILEDDLDQDPEDLNNQDPEEELEDDLEPQDNALTLFLKERGINPDSIKIEKEDGTVEETHFDDLSLEEQLLILNYNTSSQDSEELDQEEIDLINELRSNRFSVQEYKNYLKKQAIEEYINNNSTEEYNVDDIPDDELYIIDLKAKVPELSDDEAAAELELAKSNESLFAKKVQGIRNEYRQKEDLLKEEKEKEIKEAEELAAKEFEDIIVKTIEENDSIDLGDSALKLTTEDMEEIASFILDSDAAGVRYIAKALNDPKTLVGMVWYALKGQEAFNQISDYYKQQISETSKVNYNKGYEDAKKGLNPNQAKAVVKKKTTPTKKILSINDLDL